MILLGCESGESGKPAAVDYFCLRSRLLDGTKQKEEYCQFFHDWG
jgi:hypothetical protein